jgi:hypothetical protein
MNTDRFGLDCTGDAVVGDRVHFERAIFGGSYRRPVFIENEIVEGEIVRDSYGIDKQQHTFTIRRDDGSTFRIKGRNLYRHGTRRQVWADEQLRAAALLEKHGRGASARMDRLARTL